MKEILTDMLDFEAELLAGFKERRNGDDPTPRQNFLAAMDRRKEAMDERREFVRQLCLERFKKPAKLISHHIYQMVMQRDVKISYQMTMKVFRAELVKALADGRVRQTGAYTYFIDEKKARL